jgi:hypothetical protein
MNVTVHVLGLTERGVRCCTDHLDTGDGAAFWLPRGGPHVGWSQPPEVGTKVSAVIPQWLASKHKQLTRVRSQPSLAFNPPAGLDPVRSTAEGSLPMAYDNEKTGALFKNKKKEKPSHPDYRGECEIGGRKFWISAWLKKSEKTGETYMSLSFREAEEQRQQSAQHQEGGDWSRDRDIPF